MVSDPEKHPDEPSSRYELADQRTTWIAGRRYYPGASLQPGEEVDLVRDPDNPHDANAVAVFTGSGELAGYLPREVAAEHAALVDLNIIRLAARLAGRGEPGFDESRMGIAPTLYLDVFVDPVRLDAFLAEPEQAPAGRHSAA